MNWKELARYVNYNFVAQAVMSALSGTRGRARIGAMDLPFNAHYTQFHKAKIDLKTKKLQNNFTQRMTIPVWKDSPKYREGFRKIVVSISRTSPEPYVCHVTFYYGAKPFNAISTKGSLEQITRYLHKELANYLRPDDALGSVQVKTLGALPVELRFRLNGVLFVVGFQYQIDGKIVLDLQTETGSGHFDLLNKTDKDRAIAFLTGNANLTPDDRDNRKRAAQIIAEIAKEIKLATPAVKKKKPRVTLPGGERAPGELTPEAIEMLHKVPGSKRIRTIKKKPTPPASKKGPEVINTKSPGKPSKIDRMNKRGFDVVEKRSITYTKKSPGKKLAGVIDKLQGTKTKRPASPKQLAARAKFAAMVKARAAAKKKGKITGYAQKPEKIVGKVAANWWAGFGKVPTKGKVNFILMPTERAAKKIEALTALSYVPRIKISVTRGKQFDKLQIVRSSLAAANAIKKFFTRDQLTTQEYGGALFLDKENKVLGCYVGFIGGIDSAVMDPRLIFGAALEVGATAIILYHNHPSGQLRSSQADRNITARFKKLSNEMEIPLMDHIIITNNGYFSLAENNEM